MNHLLAGEVPQDEVLRMRDGRQIYSNLVDPTLLKLGLHVLCVIVGQSLTI